MAIKLGNTNINVFGNNWIKAYLGNTLVFGGAVTQYYLDLDRANSDGISISDSEFHYEVPATGDYYMEAEVDTSQLNGSTDYSVMGKDEQAANSKRYFLDVATGRLRFASGLSVNNCNYETFLADFPNQIVIVRGTFTATGRELSVNGVVKQTTTSTIRPVPSTDSMYIGRYSNPSSKTFNGGIYSWDFNGDKTRLTEGSGINAVSDGGVSSVINTSNLDPNYINDFMWQPLI